MKKSKLETLMTDFLSAQEKRGSMEAEIANLEGRAAALRKESEAAAEADNPDLYTLKKREAEALEDRIYVRKKTLEKATSARPRPEVNAAWDEYRTTHDKAIATAGNAVDSALNDLCAVFRKYVEMIRQANAAREDCAFLLGKTEGGSYYWETVNEFYLPQMMPTWTVVRDFLRRAGKLEQNEFETISTILGVQRSH